MIYLGIDPGLDGAVAYIRYCGDHVQPHVEVFDTPTLTVKATRGMKREYNTSAMAARLRTWKDADSAVAVIEKVHAMPGQGVRSMFSMGYGLGLWEMALTALGVPFRRVAPQTWQKLMLADEGRGKDAARLQAQRLFPTHAELFARKKDDGRADAILMAEYGRRTAA